MNLVEYKYSIDELEEYIANNKLTEHEWKLISYSQKLTETFIEKYNDKVCWVYISLHQTVSERFIEKYIKQLSWIAISTKQKLSESFIERYIDKVYWSQIVKYQPLSYAFMEKHLYRYSLVNHSVVNKEHFIKLRVEYSYKYYIDKLKYEFSRE